MPHDYNRAAFQSGIGIPNVLLSLYCSLVDLELAIKNHFLPGNWRSGHRVIDWIAELNENALAVQLRNALFILQCTGRDGNPVPVGENS